MNIFSFLLYFVVFYGEEIIGVEDFIGLVVCWVVVFINCFIFSFYFLYIIIVKGLGWCEVDISFILIRIVVSGDIIWVSDIRFFIVCYCYCKVIVCCIIVSNIIIRVGDGCSIYRKEIVWKMCIIR